MRVCGSRFAAGSVVLFLVALSASAAPKKKSVEARYKAPMQSAKYEVSVKAPQVIDGEKFSAVITVTMLGEAKLTSATIKTEVSAPAAVKAQLVQHAHAPEESDVTVHFTVDKPGTHELVVGLVLELAGEKEPVLVAVPLSVTRARAAPDAAR